MRMCLMFLLLVASVAHGAKCYVEPVVGKSQINISFADRVNREIFNSGYATGDYKENNKGTTGGVEVGCTWLNYHWLRLGAELGVVEGFKFRGQVSGTARYQQLEQDFTAEAVFRARAYTLAMVGEVPITDHFFFTGRLGVAYAQATGDLYPMDLRVQNIRLALHGEADGVIPVVGIGGGVAFGRVAVLAEGRVLGIPWREDRRANEFRIGLRYTF